MSVSEGQPALTPDHCREELGAPDYRKCGQPAEFILWGKLLRPEALGPRCYDHAAQHVGHRALNDPAWAIYDLRKVEAVLAREREATERAKELLRPWQHMDDEPIADTIQVLLDSQAHKDAAAERRVRELREEQDGWMLRANTAETLLRRVVSEWQETSQIATPGDLAQVLDDVAEALVGLPE